MALLSGRKQRRPEEGKLTGRVMAAAFLLDSKHQKFAGKRVSSILLAVITEMGPDELHAFKHYAKHGTFITLENLVDK